jgi:exopolysaccharide biosynthesis polyprenyl glycosylphosphotransferase
MNAMIEVPASPLRAVPQYAERPAQPRSSIDPARLRRRVMIADLCAIVVGLTLAMGVQAVWRPIPKDDLLSEWLVIVASLPFWVAAARTSRLYTARANARIADEFRHLVIASSLGVVAVVVLAFAFGVSSLSRWMALVIFLSVLPVWFVTRQIVRAAFARLRREGRLTRPILVVGTDDHASALVQRVRARPDLGYSAVGLVGDHPPDEAHGIPWLGDVDSIEEIASACGVNSVVISLFSVDGHVVNALTRRLTDRGLHVALATCLRDIDIDRLLVQQIDGQALLYIEPRVRTGWRRAAMRVFDVSVALVGLVLTLPIIAISAIAIRIESPGFILYRQRRVGERGRSFEMLKLRTMYVGADTQRNELLSQNESDGPLFKIKDDPRVTRVGRFLRKFSIDEIPQFWNVVRGEMSVVGPRPALPSEVQQWTPDVHQRLEVLPGITGMWQVSGRSETTFEEYKRLDMYYVDNWSLAHDLKIVFRTIWVVLVGRGAS